MFLFHLTLYQAKWLHFSTIQTLCLRQNQNKGSFGLEISMGLSAYSYLSNKRSYDLNHRFIWVYDATFKTAQGYLARKSFTRKILKLYLWLPRGGFLSYWNYQLIKFEEEKRFGLINTFENFPCKISLHLQNFFLAIVILIYL